MALQIVGNLTIQVLKAVYIEEALLIFSIYRESVPLELNMPTLILLVFVLEG